MSSLIREPRHQSILLDRRLSIATAFLVILGATFLLAPGSIALKTHMALHGLCAQRPSHSLLIGGTALPMDARMTGIYIGAAVAVGCLIAYGRLRAARTPSRAVVVLLALFVVALAVDGFNALLVDLGATHPYEPSNELRLATGILAGTALGVVLGHLFAASMWAQPDRRRSVVASPFEPLAPVGISAAIGALAAADLAILYAPLAVGLLLAAIGVFSLLGIIIVALVSDRGWSHRSFNDLVPLAMAGFAAAVLIVGGLAWFRFMAEKFLGLPQLT